MTHDFLRYKNILTYLLMVELGIVATRLDYCKSLRYGTSSDNLSKLHATDLYAKLREHAAPQNCAVYTLHWLPVTQRID